MKTPIVSVVFQGVAASAVLHGATLTGSQGMFTGTAALPAVTGSDWAYYATSPPIEGAPTNTSGPGSATFTVSTLGTNATSLLGSGTNISSFAVSFTDGTSPASSSGLSLGGIRNNLTGSSAVGNGLQLSLPAMTGASQIKLWTYLFTADATLKAYAYDPSGEDPGVLIYSQAISVGDSTLKQGYQFIFDYLPTGTNDAIRFEYVMDASRGTTANIGFAAISTTPVPEPGVVALGVLALFPAAFSRRRRKD